MIKHHHFIGRFEVATPPLEADRAYLVDWMRKLIEGQGMNVLSGPHVAFVDKAGNRGLTGVAIIETSHVAVHIWDETSPGTGAARFLHLRHARQGRDPEGDRALGRGQELIPGARPRAGCGGARNGVSEDRSVAENPAGGATVQICAPASVAAGTKSRFKP